MASDSRICVTGLWRTCVARSGRRARGPPHCRRPAPATAGTITRHD
ncbi:hypothetical protein GZL_08709 [Streptomyces sp. 769]|nr:hypothetical protein GZL_08709 [Streptomyces sp. 769]